MRDGFTVRHAWSLAVAVVLAVLMLAGERGGGEAVAAQEDGKRRKRPKVVYPKRTKLDFEGIDIEGELKSPAEFYFQHRPSEKFDSLVQRRKNFHREMLRDVVLSK